jgi:hypothetical protein
MSVPKLLGKHSGPTLISKLISACQSYKLASSARNNLTYGGALNQPRGQGIGSPVRKKLKFGTLQILGWRARHKKEPL